MKIDEAAWTLFQNHLGYSDEEMKKFREDPKNEEVLLKAPGLMSKTIVAEVIESHGCNSQHKVGDKFFLDGAGNVISKLCPSRMCIHALSALPPAVHGLNELYYAGADTGKMLFNKTGCPDVGVQCGGWGHIVMEIRMEDRKK
jgi:uncharacterized repeat protein (TIGR04076 family)